LKNKKALKPDYRAFERKMFVKIAQIMASALIAVFLLFSLARGYAGNIIVAIMRYIFGIKLSSALELYDRIVRSNLEYILLGVMAIFFLIMVRFLLSQFSKYFMEISEGLDILVGT